MNRLWLPVDDGEQDSGRPLRQPAPLFPVAKSSRTDTKSGRKGALGHAQLPADILYVDRRRHVDHVGPNVAIPAFGVGYSVLQTLKNLGTYGRTPLLDCGSLTFSHNAPLIAQRPPMYLTGAGLPQIRSLWSVKRRVM